MIERTETAPPDAPCDKKYVVFTIADDGGPGYCDFIWGRSEGHAVEIVENTRGGYAIGGSAWSADELRGLADDLDTSTLQEPFAVSC